MPHLSYKLQRDLPLKKVNMRKTSVKSSLTSVPFLCFNQILDLNGPGQHLLTVLLLIPFDYLPCAKLKESFLLLVMSCPFL